MKRFFSYGLLSVMLLLSVTVIYTTPYEKILTTTIAAGLNRIAKEPNATPGHTLSAPSEKDCFFLPPNTPVSPLAINNVVNAGVPTAYAKIGGNTYHLLKSCFLLLNNRRFFITQSTYKSQYARKAKDGYYLYALRQLRI